MICYHNNIFLGGFDMAYVEGEKRNLLTPVAKGPEVEVLKFRTTFNGEDCHYPAEMISGCKMVEKCIDCCTELSNIRDNGDGGYVVEIQSSLIDHIHMLDAVEIIVWVVKQGSRSRIYGYEMYKTSEFDGEADRSIIFDEPVLCVKGTATFVVDDPIE